MRHPNFDLLSVKELESMLNPSAIIPMLQTAISMESTTKEANDILNNDIEFLTSDYRISQAQILVSLLRRSQIL
jgi:hypothetical protein